MKFAWIALSLLISPSAFALTIYTDRPTARVEIATKVFTEETGQSVTIVEQAYSALKKKLDEEPTAEADLIFVKDLVFLAELSSNGYLQPTQSNVVSQSVEPSRRDPNGLWQATSVRARTMVYALGRVNPSELSTYENLASSNWEGRLCVRTSKSSYNDGLIGFLLEQYGNEKAKSILQGWMKNLAAPVFPNDTAVIEAIANGQCDVGVVNSYYLAGVLQKNPNFPVGIVFANQNEGGVHVNGAGVGILQRSKNVDAATKFIEILYRDEIQLALSSSHLEYPAKKGLLPDTFIRNWGEFLSSAINWNTIGKRATEARKLAEEVGYN